jgi:hypothetical protein
VDDRGRAAPALDRLTLLPIVMRALLADDVRPVGDPDEVGMARIICDGEGVLAGIPVAKEMFGRLGGRCRARVDEGAPLRSGDEVADLGGPLAALRGVAPTALRIIDHLSAVASGVLEPDHRDALDVYAAALRLSADASVGDHGPTFRMVIDPDATTG